jgi:hypothetical protein
MQTESNMIKSTVKFSLLGLTALVLAVNSLNAAEQTDKKPEAKTPSKAERTGVAVPFHGAVKSKTDASFTIEYRTKDLTIEVTSETKITKEGKPATLAEAVVGEEVSGQYRILEDKKVARFLRVGAKPATPAVDKAKKPEAKPDAKPETAPKAK